MRVNSFFPISKPLKAGLSRQFLLILLGIIIAIFSVIYIFSVPLIQQKVFEIERNSSRIALNNVFEIANRMYANVEQSRKQALDSHQKQLKVAVSLSASYIKTSLEQSVNEGRPSEEVKKRALANLRNFTYGNNDYIWVANYDGKLISHPDPQFLGDFAPQPRDENGNFILDSIIEKT